MWNRIKNLSLYSIAALVSSGLPLLFLPIFSSILSPADFGKIRVYNNYILLLSPLITFATGSFLFKEYYVLSAVNFRNLFVTNIRIPLVLFLISFVLIIPAALFFNSAIGFSVFWILLIPFFVLFSGAYEFFLNCLVYQKKALLYSICCILKTVFELCISFILIVNLNMMWEGRLYSLFIILLIIFIVSFFYFKRTGWLEGTYNKELLRPIIIYTFPIIIHLLGKFTLNQVDTIYISKMISDSEAGIYSLGYQIGAIVALLSNVFINVYSPFLYENLTDVNEEKKARIVKTSYLFLGVLAIFAIALTLSAEFIFSTFFNYRFMGGTKYVFWTSLSYLFWAGYLVNAGYLFYFNKTMLLAKISIFNLVLNLILNYFLIKHFNTIGASYATAISFFINFIIVTYYANQQIKLPWFSWFKKSNA